MATKTAGETLLEKLENEAPEGDDLAEESAPEAVEEEKPKRRRRKTPETPAEEAEAIEEEHETEVPETPEWMQRLQSELGIENPESPEDAIARAIEIARENERAAEEALQWRRENEPFASYGREHYQPVRREEEKESPPKPWQVMQYPQEAESFISGRNPETGEIQWKPNTPNEVKLRVEQWQGTEAQHTANLVRPDLFWKQMQDFFDSQFTEKAQPFYEERTKEQQREQLFNKYVSDNSGWLYTRDPRTGHPTEQFSQSGEFFDQRVAFHLDRGHTPEDAIRYAQFDYQERTGETPWVKQNGQPAAEAPAQSVEEIREQQRKEHARKPLRGAKRTPTRNGSFTDPEDEVPQNDNLSFGQRIIQKRDALGIASQPYSNA